MLLCLCGSEHVPGLCWGAVVCPTDMCSSWNVGGKFDADAGGELQLISGDPGCEVNCVIPNCMAQYEACRAVPAN